jgi:PAS domain S-box-containing protein
MRLKFLNGLIDRFTFLRSLAVFFIAILGGLIMLGILFYQNNQAFNNGASQITHTSTVIAQAGNVLTLSQNMQWEARNYILTNESNALNTYNRLRDSMQAATNELTNLVSDNHYQYANATKLQQQVMQLIAFTDSSLRLKNIPTNQFIGIVKQYIAFHKEINKQLQLIKSEETRLLALRRSNVVKTVDTTYNIFIASGMLILILLAGAFVFIFYHFSKRQKVEKALADSENRFRILINSTKDLAIFMTDRKGCIVNWYEGAHKIKGYNKEEVIGKNISIFYTPEAIQNGEPEQNLQTAAEQGSFETEGWRVRKDGSRFWADVLITAVYNEEGRAEGFTKVTRDFSLHKQAEDEIKNLLQKEKELNQMKSNFVSMASHEFRTPLSTILSSISLLEHYKTTEMQDKRDKHIKRIKSSVNEMVAILEEFLSLEKIEEGKVHVKKEVFNLKELAEQTHAKFNTVLKPGQAILYKHTGKEEVCIDAGFINHILNNLLSNAVKYSLDDTDVTLETSVNENSITLKVQDHGIGISNEDQKHLFERFFRASNTGGIKGTGLGLHIVKRYIDLLQGNIWLKSEIGNGSTFTVTFPFET